ncbi:hypothetical protein EYF80_059212 [Liparis tanakae]|uniref:Uncharacterized protein n=1 Tax=Liparis tanakae TaxID=230148 RepID=A0A4Z2EP11_9TELE|nr:hypothetical protein EYF80_059212 [Liparis tanakae]
MLHTYHIFSGQVHQQRFRGECAELEGDGGHVGVPPVPQSDSLPIQEGLPDAAGERRRSHGVRLLEDGSGNTMRSAGSSTASRTYRDGRTDLDGADYPSDKQVGLLVHVQDGEGRGRVGAGRSGRRPGHRAFQRIHRYGAIQPITGDGEEQKDFDVTPCQTVPMTEDIKATLNQFL